MKEILKLCPPEQLVTHYKIGTFKFGDVDDFLLKIATVRGKLKKGGIVDINAAARIVLHDWNEGMHTLIDFAKSYTEKLKLVSVEVKNEEILNALPN